MPETTNATFNANPGDANPGKTQPAGNFAWIPIFATWVVATVATLGSLFFSEVMQLPPCNLCWYQRICMYPLVLILSAALLSDSPRQSVFRYAFPLALTGWGIALFHNLLYYGVLPENAAPCQQGVPCTAVQLELLGFITIPLLSLVAFSLLLGLLTFIKKRGVPHES